jgi:serine/threonine-protein kinase
MHVNETIGGRYRLIERLGSGAFGVVWSAEELLGDKVISQVAIKVFTAQVDVSELQYLAAWDHPKVLRYRTIVEHEEVGRQYVCLVTELAEGGDVASMLRSFRKGLPPVQVERIIGSIAEALDYLHGRDPPIVHRDIKPQNMLVVGGTYKLGDVGTARALEGGGRDTSRGLGSLAYTAPERFDRKISSASDMYSLAVSAYELLTNQWVYEGEDLSRATEAQLVKGHLMGAPQIRGDLPPNWQDLLSHCLSKEPTERWSAARVAEFLSGRKAFAVPQTFRT